MLRNLTLMLVVLFTSSCSTVIVHSQKDRSPGPYSGTAQAIEQTKKSWHSPTLYGEVFWTAFDVPLSFVADTIILPYDLIQSEELHKP